MSTGENRLPDLDFSMELEQVYWYFFAKFQDLQSPRSVAEARITSEEIEKLQSWFDVQYGKPRNWCDRTWQEKIEGTHTASSREMFGALFLILASEIGRDHSSEESLWPSIAEKFRTNKSTHAVLFGNDHPTEISKIAMAAGVRKLRLRNLIDRSGKQEYFDTIKLQIGFTYKGALRRMPDWLDGLGSTTAVQTLLGTDTTVEDFDVSSSSFQKLWSTLREFRAGRISFFAASQMLHESPWIRGSWVSPLLEVAKLQRPRPQSAPPNGETYVSEAFFDPVFSWDTTSRPCIQLKLNEERIYDLLAGKSTAAFTVDGVVVDRWSMEAGGGFRGSRLLACQKTGQPPNLRPQNFSISCNGEPIESIDLAGLGLDEPFLIFDLSSGAKVDANEVLEPNRDYALVCDGDMTVPGAQFAKGKGRSVFRLSRPLTQTTQLRCGEDLVWEPRLSELRSQRLIRVVLESDAETTLEIGSRAQLTVTGVPEDAESAALCIGTGTTQLIRCAGGWKTSQAVSISLDLITGNVKIRVRVEGADYKRAVIPKLQLNLSGIAILQSGMGTVRTPSWQVPKNGRLNRASGDGWARVFDSGDFKLREGSRLIGRKRSTTIELRDLNAWGASLCADFDGINEKTLANVVEDRGCIELYLSAIFGGGSHTVYLRTPILPTSQHAVFVWQDAEAAPSVIPSDKIHTETDGFVWKFARAESAALMAIAYEGTCLGAYWNPDYVASVLRKPITAETIALFRWLKVPVLAEPFEEPLKRIVRQYPSTFLRGWLDESVLRKPLLHREAESGVSAVVRCLFWDYSERRTKQLHELANSLQSRFSHEPSASPVENFRKTLLLLGEICPSFAYSMARADVNDERYRQGILSVIHDALGLTLKGVEEVRNALRDMTRECAKLVYTTPDALSKLTRRYEAHLAGQEQEFEEITLVNRIAEYRTGREFLIASLLLYCLERTT
jgi:hypothetical protein